MRSIRLGAAAVGSAALAVALLAGCGSSPIGSASTTGGAAGTQAPSGTATSTATPLVQPTALPTYTNNPTDRKNVTQTSCKAIPGGWSAAGTVKNPGKAEATYQITVYFTTTSATVLGGDTTTVKVKAGGTAQWEVKATFPAQPQMRCPMPGIAKIG
ncbi:MAG: hypothetical protein FWD74_10505 [Actinomycetia bacterium]|nr:hypothetical protein [Actinomycetes bacterium]